MTNTIRINKNYFCFFILSSLLFSCIKESPHFEKVDNLEFETKFDTNDVFYTLVKTHDYTFYHIEDYPDPKGAFSWDCSHLYYLKTKNNLYKLEPKTDIGNGLTNFEAINDSILAFYTQQYMYIFGDFWFEKNNENIQIYYDPGLIENAPIDIEYKNGSLIRVGKHSTKIDSTMIKTRKNLLLKLENNQLKIIGNFDTLNLVNDNPISYNYDNLENGIYYFSYPGRKIDYYLNLKKIK